MGGVIQQKAASRRVLIVAVVLAGIVITVGFGLARRVDLVSTDQGEQWLEDEHRYLIAQIDLLEIQWEQALEEAADFELESSKRERGEAAREVLGLRQVSYFGKRGEAHELVEFPLQGPAPLEPSLLSGELVLTNQEVFSSHNPIWIDDAGRPLMYRKADGHGSAVVFILNKKIARGVVLGELKSLMRTVPRVVPAGGLLEFSGDSGKVWLSSGDADCKSRPADETLRHYSRFGEWPIRYWRPRKEVVSYAASVLGGMSLVALLILVGGYWADREQARALTLAAQRVSFVNSVSHEFRTPLTNILLTTELAQEDSREPKAERRLALILDEGRRLSRMVDNVLSYARAERGKLQLGQVREVKLAEFLESCLQQFEILFARKGINCELDVSGDARVEIEVDFLSQIVLNLLSNIEKYAGDGAVAKVEAVVGKTLRITVSDNGVGIPAELKFRIFDAFERGGDSVTSTSSGTGLGLAISRELARSMGGDLQLKNSTNGAVFLLEIPLF